ncbi:MAG: DUF975 family protein [Clostridia bacterium]|nr:DUF975 family protein [Clostridia bacterium]
MKFAADFRRIARETLTGKWFIAVAVGFVAVILGALGSDGPKVEININASNADVSFSYAGQNIFSTGGGLNSDIVAFIAGAFFFFVVIALVMGIAYFILGSIVGVGYARFNLNLVDRKEAGFDSLFAYFSYWKTTALAKLIQVVFIFLWSLLFIIPGIVAGYSYAMTNYILAENPNMTASEAVELSKSMMYGNRWRLFCLQFSFIGWSILASLTFGIGNLWLTPYRQAATAAFYREISGTAYTAEEVATDIN